MWASKRKKLFEKKAKETDYFHVDHIGSRMKNYAESDSAIENCENALTLIQSSSEIDVIIKKSLTEVIYKLLDSKTIPTYLFHCQNALTSPLCSTSFKAQKMLKISTRS